MQPIISIMVASALVVSFGSAHADQGISLSLSRSAETSTVHLTWAGCCVPFSVYRSVDPTQVEIPGTTWITPCMIVSSMGIPADPMVARTTVAAPPNH